jgi:hypothetical protein
MLELVIWTYVFCPPMIRSGDIPDPRLGDAGAQESDRAATSALQVNSANSFCWPAAGTGVASEGAIGSEQADMTTAERINALTRFSMKACLRTGSEDQRGSTSWIPALSSGEDRTVATVDRRAHDRLEREVLEARQVIDLRGGPTLSGGRLRFPPGLVTIRHVFSRLVVSKLLRVDDRTLDRPP